jgi:predicted O-linked N-acetylglucosamine transferase (SPINDLY family)
MIASAVRKDESSPRLAAPLLASPLPVVLPPGGATIIPELFTSAMRRAMAQALPLVALITVAEALNAAGETSLVLELYRSWIAHNAADPVRHLALYNYGVALSNGGNHAGAKDAYVESILANRQSWPAYINLGSELERLGVVDQALAQWYHVVNSLAAIDGTNINYKTTTLKRIARVFENAHFDENAEAVLKLSIEIDPTQRELLAHWVSSRQNQCKWPVLEPWGHITREQLMGGVFPLSLATMWDDPLLQLGNCHHQYVHEVERARPGTVGAWPAPEAPARNRPLRVGYLSSDLRAHAVGYLTAEIFELHDRANVEVFAYFCGIVPDDPMKVRIRGLVDHWVPITEMSDKEAAARMVADGIDILVDLNGYSKDARTALVALRPAPIIVNWLGFPGTMASPDHHYIIADDWIIPPESELYYTEKVLRLPCYQPTDRKRTVAPRPTRQDLGLPEEGTVFCCLNGLQKITRAMFQHWMSILHQVPGSVLWLFAGTDGTNERVRAAAESCGIAGERIVFADKRINDQHLARYALADLFLDTFPYGAHTTASDAMWMGVPVVTVSGHGFASRVCGSLLRAAGMEELICADIDEYVARAVALGRDPGAIQVLKDRLAANRDTCTLFDTPALVRHLEALYAGMWDDYAAGRLPKPDLANLAVYRAIGCGSDPENQSLLSRDELHARYRAALAYRDSHAPLTPDPRLWPGE